VVDAVVYLVPLGRRRYELYSEPPPEEHDPLGPPRERRETWRDRLRERWRGVVQNARRREADRGWMAMLRDWAVCRVAETVAEQRTLWSLRHMASANLRYPSDLSEANATAELRRMLSRARRYHGVWLIVDGVLFAASGLLVLVPGPNIVAYYFGLRLVGHYLSWRGARQGVDRTAWRPQPEDALAELRTLATVPRDSRASRVEAIAASLNLPRLAAFFDRTATR
jgi:Mitochondrial K+-H+ exchange-related